MRHRYGSGTPMEPWKASVLLFSFLLLLQCIGGSAEQGDRAHVNSWAIRVEEPGGFERAKRIAEKHGFHKVQKVGNLEGYYNLERSFPSSRLRRSAEDQTGILEAEPGVFWAEQQDEKVREKRGFHHSTAAAAGGEPKFIDPLWEGQWYLDDKRKENDLDINVLPVWARGITGRGVVVTILDDGIEHNHTDLIKNYDPAASWDVNDQDSDPFPRYDPTDENKHGTRCAGEVAAEANNTKCGVGVAFNARIGGVRMLDGRVTDRVEAESLSLNPQHIDIYSASWGPSDDGKTVEGPGTLAMAAFVNGVTKGRRGLGSIYVWASGNGGHHDDNCNCDGYTNSIYTLSISSSSDHGESPWYSEACSATLATTLSSGAHGERRVVTTDLHDQCTERHTGTSASAPIAAGIIALALEVNPELTWRDVQHLVVFTSNWYPLKDDNDWKENGLGLHYNLKFGFGLLDAAKIVHMADPATWKSVPPKSVCSGKIHQDTRSVRWDQSTTVDIQSDACKGTGDEIRYLEHVQITLTLSYTRRGDLTIYLTSPMGTRSCLLQTRSEDTSNEGFHDWTFMTTHMWGEDPRGVWVLEIRDQGDGRANSGFMQSWKLILHGTLQKPGHQNRTHPEQPATYAASASTRQTPSKRFQNVIGTNLWSTLQHRESRLKPSFSFPAVPVTGYVPLVPKTYIPESNRSPWQNSAVMSGQYVTYNGDLDLLNSNLQQPPWTSYPAALRRQYFVDKTPFQTGDGIFDSEAYSSNLFFKGIIPSMRYFTRRRRELSKTASVSLAEPFGYTGKLLARPSPWIRSPYEIRRRLWNTRR